jgi:hypothetical protein
MHIASRKGRAKVVAELYAHAETEGILVKLLQMKDTEGKTPLGVAASDHVRSILQGEDIGGASQYDMLQSPSSPTAQPSTGRKSQSTFNHTPQARTCTLL